ncbi:MAG: hypothetical protein GKR90_23510 [Pseudomonadales bacterium]|nr:hypothetical protein [Pseudomonadales bacterium]
MNLRSHIPETLKRKQVVVSLGIVGAALLMSASIFATGPSSTPTETVEKSWPVSITHAQPKRMKPSFQAFGKLESSRIARIRSDLVLRIKEVRVREGEWVSAGDLPMQLDDRETRLKLLEKDAELKQAEANLAAAVSQLKLEKQSGQHFSSRHEVAQAKLKRHQDLIKKRLISKGLLDEVSSLASQATIEFHRHLQDLANLPNQIAALEATVAKAAALREQAELDLSHTRIVAPFDGPILAVFAAPGDHTNLSTPLVEIADSSSFEVRVQVPDNYTAAFRNDQNKEIHATTLSGKELKLSRLSSHIRAGQTGTDAFFTYTNQAMSNESILVLGQVLDLSIELSEQPHLVALPVQSIYGSERVFKVINSRLVSVPIERVGESETEEGFRLLVRSNGIAEGEAIITTQLPRAIDGLLVSVANEDQDALAETL